jgi:hypothetical protein
MPCATIRAIETARKALLHSATDVASLLNPPAGPIQQCERWDILRAYKNTSGAFAAMHVFFEDDGQLKAGTVLTDNDSSLQVEAVSGKRQKIKAASVLLRYAEPSPAQLVAEAQAAGQGARSRFPVGGVG